VRRFVILLLVVGALAALWIWVPSMVVQRQLEGYLAQLLQARGPVSVWAATSPFELARGRIDRLDVTAADARLGEVTADRVRASFRGVATRRVGVGLEIAGVSAGTVELEITQENLVAYLAARGVEGASVRIEDEAVVASGMIRAGPVLASATVRGQFYVVDRSDVYFRVDALNLSGMAIPPNAATAALGMAGRPLATLRGLPVPASVERIATTQGRLVVYARVGASP
jgi:hypothetical protein